MLTNYYMIGLINVAQEKEGVKNPNNTNHFRNTGGEIIRIHSLALSESINDGPQHRLRTPPSLSALLLPTPPSCFIWCIQYRICELDLI